MPGFTRRYSFQPPQSVITQIEGIIIVDLPQPGDVNGVGTGVALLAGEFADCTFGVAVDSSGTVTTSPNPVQITSGQDLLNKLGGWDETLGDFGNSQGNGFAALRNKKFAGLVCVPVNIADSKGTRYMRDLPLCKSPADTTPVVPMSGGSVPAGTEYRYNGVGRIRSAALVNFTAFQPIVTGVGGVANNNTGPATTAIFNATPGFDWTTVVRPNGDVGTYVGDILVIGNNNGGAKQPLNESGTYRVQAQPTSGAAVTVEKLDGSSFTWTGPTNVPWRLHIGSDADSARTVKPGSTTPGGYAAADIGGYTVPTRPITNATGGSTNGSFVQGTDITPLNTPPATTGSSWSALSGLVGRIMPGASGGLGFTAAVQGINAPSSASLDALYVAAIDATLNDDVPENTTNLIWAARKSSNIRNKLHVHVDTASEFGLGRMTVIAPELSVQSLSTVVGGADPGVGANRDERVIYTWPGNQNFVPEAVNFKVKTADGNTTLDGNLDESFDSFFIAVLSNLPPENNPGQTAPPVNGVLGPVLGLQRGAPTLGIQEYITLRQNGVAALKMDRTDGPSIQSGITTSLTSGQTNINRRRMADLCEDSLAVALKPFCKLPLTNDLIDTALGEVNAFGAQLLSTNNPKAQRIQGFSVDGKSGNTQNSLAAGIYVIIFRARMLPTADFIVLQAEIGPNVDVPNITQLSA